MPTMNYFTNAVAATAATSVLWLPTIADMAPVASFILTVLGIVWLIVQIYFKVYDNDRSD